MDSRPTAQTENELPESDLSERRRLAWAWTAVGYVFFGIGLVGALLPVLPTTIFWIAAAGCFAKGCPAMARRIYAWPGFGPAVEAFLSHGVIARKGKIGALAGMALAIVFLLLSPLSAETVLVTVAVILLAALYVVTRPSRRPEARQSADA